MMVNGKTDGVVKILFGIENLIILLKITALTVLQLIDRRIGVLRVTDSLFGI